MIIVIFLYQVAIFVPKKYLFKIYADYFGCLRAFRGYEKNLNRFWLVGGFVPLAPVGDLRTPTPGVYPVLAFLGCYHPCL